MTYDVAGLQADAARLRAVGEQVDTTARRVHSRWSRDLPDSYDAPEVTDLVAGTLRPVDKAVDARSDLEGAAAALATLASTVGPLQQRLDSLRADAAAFRSWALSLGPPREWDREVYPARGQSGAEVNKNLANQVGDALNDILQAEAACVSTIVRHTSTAALPPPSEIPRIAGNRGVQAGPPDWRRLALTSGTNLPWGGPQIKEPGEVASLVGGFVTTFVGQPIEFLGGLAGLTFDRVTGTTNQRELHIGWEASTARRTWLGLGALGVMANPSTWLVPGLRQRNRQTWNGLWRGLSASDERNGWRRSGMVLGNIAGLLLPSPSKGIGLTDALQGVATRGSRVASDGGVAAKLGGAAMTVPYRVVSGQWLFADVRLAGRGLGKAVHSGLDRMFGDVPVRPPTAGELANSIAARSSGGENGPPVESRSAGGTARTAVPGPPGGVLDDGHLLGILTRHADDPAALATAVREHFAGLSATDRRDLAFRHSEVVSRLDGVPSDARSWANLARVERDLEALRALEKPDWLERRRLKALEAMTQPIRDPVTREMTQPQVLRYDGRRGRAVVAYGDLARADRHAIFVPGMFNSLNSFPNIKENLEQWADGAALSHSRTATVAWLGYRPPRAFGGLHTRVAESAGQDLNAFIRQFQSEHHKPTVLVAHSYGSLTSRYALQAGDTRFEAVVLIGSPGVGRDIDSLLRLPGMPPPDRVFWANAPWDPISWSGWHAAPQHGVHLDASDGFFHTVAGGFTKGDIGRSIGAVIAGDYARVVEATPPLVRQRVITAFGRGLGFSVREFFDATLRAPGSGRWLETAPRPRSYPHNDPGHNSFQQAWSHLSESRRQALLGSILGQKDPVGMSAYLVRDPAPGADPDPYDVAAAYLLTHPDRAVAEYLRRYPAVIPLADGPPGPPSSRQTP
ncbi:alpha/beta hydrolase [Micromonospora rosaria]|uniref:alpha/beta hydrolase n=1 Tax=Micromonospora rosaria TaxID=47874 RepID=UPI0014717950|nr:alpha/beta hydrolase [Micromonospora rosaria]